MLNTLSLNGTWKYVPTYDQKPNNNHNVIECDTPLYAHPSLVRTGWEEAEIPSVWQRYSEKYSVYEGVFWYYREFELDDISDTSFVNLVFKGVNYRADVYINAKYAGWHESGYTSFSMDISSLVKKGKNCIAVCVDNRPIIVKWPNDWGYGVFGGIHRDVFIEVYNNDYISNITVNPDFDTEKSEGILHICGNAHNADKVLIEVGDKKEIIEVTEGDFSKTLRFHEITAWTPETPTLYNMKISMGNTVYKESKIGFRNVKCESTKFFLNGKETAFKGACYLCDSPVQGLAMDKSHLYADLSKMKEANVDAIRTHYPMSDVFYELCDEMGFMVWIEPNIYCSKPSNDTVGTIFSDPEFIDAAVSMTKEMVNDAKGYASVVIFGIGNECNVKHPEAMPFFEKIAETVRENDSTRLAGYAALFDLIGDIYKLVDILGVNSYYGWYDKIPTFDIIDTPEMKDGMIIPREADVSGLHSLMETVRGLVPDTLPILLTEFGADSVPGYNSPANVFWSEEYHASVVRNYIKEAKKHNFIVGTFVFAFTDYSDPSKPVNGRWNGYNLKGMISYDRNHKKPYFALKDAYSK